MLKRWQLAKTVKRVTFGTFDLDLDTGELRRAGIRLKLQDKPFQLLAMLVERPGELVSREQVCKRLWPADTFVDFDHGLNTAVRKLRLALGDSADNPRFVETVARRGYRFIAPVSVGGFPSEAASDAPSPTPNPTPEVSPATWTTSGRLRWLTALGVGRPFAASRSVGWIATRRAASAPPKSVHIAVLPFKVLTADPAEKTWGIGLADAIIARLANFKTLRVRPTASVFKYDADTSDPQQAGAELGAEHVLTGTLHKRERDYRITLLLTQTSNGAAIRGSSYDVPHHDLSSIDDRVAAQVAEALRVQLSSTERANRRAAPNPAAYELYLQARGLMDVRSEARLLASIEAYKKSLNIDPQYARAHAGLATALAWFSIRYELEPEALKWGKLAVDAAYQALTLDAELAEAHLAIASTAGTLYGHFNWARTLAETDAALAIDPEMYLAYLFRGRALYHLGLFDAANRAIAKSLALNPTVESQRLQLAVDLFSGQFEDVRARGEGLMKEATAPVLSTYVGTALFYLGDRQRSADMLASVKRGDQPDARSQAVLAGVLAASGHNVEALATVDRLIRGPYMDHHVAYSLAAAYAQLRRPSDVVIWLRRAFDEGLPCYPWFARDPMLDPVRQEQAYIDLMRELRPRFEAARLQYDGATH